MPANDILEHRKLYYSPDNKNRIEAKPNSKETEKSEKPKKEIPKNDDYNTYEYSDNENEDESDW